MSPTKSNPYLKIVIYRTITLSLISNKTTRLMALCNILGCNTEANFKVMFHHFDRFHKKPYFKEIMRLCELHAKQLDDDDLVTKIQILN